jgi:hypothetical protein
VAAVATAAVVTAVRRMRVISDVLRAGAIALASVHARTSHSSAPTTTAPVTTIAAINTATFILTTAITATASPVEVRLQRVQVPAKYFLERQAHSLCNRASKWVTKGRSGCFYVCCLNLCCEVSKLDDVPACSV